MKKLAAVINKSLDPGRAMNALAHISLGLGASIGPHEASLVDYADQDQHVFPNVSKYPFVILRASERKISNLYSLAKERGIKFVAFTDTMTVGSWEDQIDRTLSTKHDDLKFFGIVLLGPFDQVSELTKKFSLWK